MKDKLLKEEQALDKKIKLKYQNRDAKLHELTRLKKAIERIEGKISALESERAMVHATWLSQNEPGVPHKFKAGDVVVSDNGKLKILGLKDSRFYECIDPMIVGHVSVAIVDVDKRFKLVCT